MTSPAALQGASLAFHKRQPSAPAASASTIRPSRSNSALTAATLSAQSTGTSITSSHHGLSPDRSVIASRLQQLGHGPQQFLQPPRQGNKHHDGRKDASFIAATLAASRSASPSPRRRVSAGSLSAVEEREKVVDEGSIGTAGSLISMFEGGRAVSPDRTPRKRDARRSVEPSPARDPGLDRPLRHASPMRQAYTGIPTKLAPNGLPPKPSKPPKPVVRSITPPPKPVVHRRAPTNEWPLESGRQGPDPPSGNVKGTPTKVQRPTSRPLTPPPKPLTESQPRIKSRTAHNDDNGKMPFLGIRDSDGLTRKPSTAPKPPAPLQAQSHEPPARQAPESVSYNARKQPFSSPANTPVQQNRSQTGILSPKPTRVSKPALPPPTPPQYQRGVSRPVPNSEEVTSPGDPTKRDTPSKPQPPTPPKPRGSVKVTRTPTNASRHGTTTPKTVGKDRKVSEADSAHDVFVSAPTSPELSSPPLPVRKQSTANSMSSPRLSLQRPSHAVSSSNLNLDSLTSAMMAGSLAASRLTPSNTGSSLPLPPRQKSPRLRQTMRKEPDSSDSEEDRYKKGRRRAKLRSGKHAHHEGSRKKWRDEVSQRERKRYEAVWASNRGLHLQPSRSSAASSVHSGQYPEHANYVANVVVRDIWRRSRLPEDELGEVWNLVDREKRGQLGRAEFVVGMWLIDQRLKGRKIPTKVSDSVWGSANGLRVKAPKGR